MRYLLQKDKKRREIASCFEKNSNFNHSIMKDTRLKFELKLRLDRKVSGCRIHSNWSFTRLKNRCVLSARSGSVLRFFRLSRISFREMANSGQLVGVRRSSW